MKKILVLVLAVALIAATAIGGTMAYFTDTTASSKNIIATGTLDVEMEWAKGTENPYDENTGWKNAANGAIFDYDLWEPGYTEVRHVRIANNGTLALDYSVSIAATGDVSALADVIDVYYFDPAQQISARGSLSESNRIGTLSEVLANLSTTGQGTLNPGEAHTLTIALKMQESAGNEYQDMSIGSEFAVQVYAEQAMVESDSFGSDYDSGAAADPNVPADLPKATVTKVDETITMNIWDITTFKQTGDTVTLDVAYTFETTETAEEAAASPYANWITDFVISFDKDIDTGTAGLGGDYGDFKSIAFYSPMDIKANEPIRLLDSVNMAFTYEDICTDVVSFLCGAFDVDGQNAGTTMTVQLNIYEVDENGNETEKYYTIGEYDYTF